MRKLVFALTLGLTVAVWSPAEVIWSQPRDFYVDPPEGWTFVEDPTPEHFVMTDPGRHLILEIFSQEKGSQKDLDTKIKALKAALGSSGDEEKFPWNDRPAWLGDQSWTMKLESGPLKVRGWALIADDNEAWVSALAYTPEKDYDKASDALISALNSLALGLDGRHQPGPLSAYFSTSSGTGKTEALPVAGLPSTFTFSYSVERDDAIRATMERETRVLMAQTGTKVSDQKAIAPAWSRFYRQVYRDLYESLIPLSEYWKTQVRQKRVTKEDLPQTILSWLQSYAYSRKGGLTDISTPWQTLKEKSGDCDSKSVLYLALMDQLGYSGILMVSAPYSHAMAALDVPGQGAHFGFDNKNWLVAELTASVKLGADCPGQV